MLYNRIDYVDIIYTLKHVNALYIYYIFTK